MKHKLFYGIFILGIFAGLGAFFYTNPSSAPLESRNSSSELNQTSSNQYKNILTLKTLDQLDPSKPTVCNITINSDDEKKVFNSYLKKDFNMVELIDEENDEWFEDSCKSGLKCDILLISGHFGGSFFGKSVHTLPATKIENMSCQSQCSGILKNPKEVFLFGCNTTAGKEPDSRTPQEYADILYNEHRDVYHSRELAELHAALRYSPVGTQTQDKMRRSFPNATIYGFHSVAPSGKNIKGALKKYFKQIKDYPSSFKTEKGHLKTWDSLMKRDYNIRTVKGAGADKNNPICILGSKEPIVKKLSWIDSVFKEKNGVLTYAPNIHEYFKTLDRKLGEDISKWPQEEVSYLERLQNNKEAKDTVSTFLSAPLNGLLSVQINLLNLGDRVGWYKKSERKKIQKSLFGDIFKKNLSLEEKDRICSLQVELDLSLEDLPKEKWNDHTIQALGCVRPQDEKIHLMIAELLKDSSPIIRTFSVYALGKIEPQNEKIHLMIAELLKDSDSDVRNAAMNALGEIKPKNEKIHLMIAEYLKDPSPTTRAFTLYALGKIKPQNEKIHRMIAERLTDSDSEVQYAAADALGKIKPQNEKIHLMIAERLKDSDSDVRNAAMNALGEIKPKNEKIHLMIAEYLKDPSPTTRAFTLYALGKIKPQNEKIHRMIAERLTDSDSEVQYAAANALGKIKPKNEKVLLYIVNLLTTSDAHANAAAIYALRQIKSLNEKVRKAIIDAGYGNHLGI